MDSNESMILYFLLGLLLGGVFVWSIEPPRKWVTVASAVLFLVNLVLYLLTSWHDRL